MRTAIVHYWLIDRRGGERVLETLCELYPDADLFTNVFDPEPFRDGLGSRRITTSFVNRLPFARSLYRWYLPLMPLALEELDLRGYELVISCESGPAKGVVVDPGAIHVCYCLSPMRYAWDLRRLYLEDAGRITALILRPLLHYLRAWDYLTAQRVDTIIALSDHVRRRVATYWRREAQVIPPPVDVDRFTAVAESTPRDRYFLCAGQLEAYKRVDLAVTALTQLGLPLVVAGVGPQSRRLRRIAGPNVRFVGHVSDNEFARLLAGCRALIFPGEEDFGIVPVEAMAAGRPVIAFGRGGVLDTVVDGMTGVLFDRQEVGALVGAVQRFEATSGSFDAAQIRNHARQFDRKRFKERFAAAVELCVSQGRMARAP